MTRKGSNLQLGLTNNACSVFVGQNGNEELATNGGKGVLLRARCAEFPSGNGLVSTEEQR